MPKILTLDDFKMSTFKVRFDRKNNGSCLLCRYDKDHILLFSAHHVFAREHSQFAKPFMHNGFRHEIHFEILRQFGNLDVWGTCTRPADDSDICMILIKNNTVNLPIAYEDLVQHAGFSVGDEVFMFGFPFITNENNIVFSGNPLDESYMCALLRHGYIMGSACEYGRNVILFDMCSNPGFSGGPIVLKYPLDEPDKFGYSFLGVMCGSYLNVDGEHKPVPHTNSGISYGCDVFKIVGYVHGFDCIKDPKFPEFETEVTNHDSN